MSLTTFCPFHYRFEGKYHHPLFHRDRSCLEDLSSIRRRLKKLAKSVSTRSTTSPLTIAKHGLIPQGSECTASTRSTRKTRGTSPTKLAGPRKLAKKAKISFAAPLFNVASADSRTGSGPDKLWSALTSSFETDSKPHAGKDARPKTPAAAVVPVMTEEHQAKADNDDQVQTGNAMSRYGADLIVLDDLQTAALSLYDEASLEALSVDIFGGQEAGLPCGDFCSAPVPEALFSLGAVPPNTTALHPIQYPSRLSATFAAHPPTDAYFIPIASSSDKLSPNDHLTNPVVSNGPVTTLGRPLPLDGKLASIWVDESDVHSSTGHSVLARRPSAEHFSKYWSDDSTSELSSPFPTCDTSQTIASFLSREEELAQEAENAREMTPTCGKVTLTLYDQVGEAFVPMSPCRGMMSPIDPNAIQGSDYPMERWSVDSTSPVASTGEQDSSLFATPVETDSVVDKRIVLANLKTADAKQNQWWRGNFMHGNPTVHKGCWHQVGSRFVAHLPVGMGTSRVGVREQGTATTTKRKRII
jgi:hypothetical protein